MPASGWKTSVFERGRELIGVAIVLCLGLAAVFGEARGKLATHLAGAVDNRLFLNVLQWHVHAMGQGKSWRELWQIPVLYPEANMLATSEHMLGEVVLFAPFYWVSGNPILSYNLMFVLVTVLNFLSAYVVARHFLRSPVAALLAALLFTFGSYRLYQILHLHLWMHFPTPFIFLAVVQTAERPGWRWPLLAGLGLAAQFYLSMYLGYFAVIMIAVMLLTLLLYTPVQFMHGSFLLRLGLGGALAAVLIYPLLGPYQAAAQRWGCWSWEKQILFFMPGWQNFFTAKLDGDEASPGLGWCAERAVYLGYITWALFFAAVAGLFQQRLRQTERPPFWAVASVALVGALCCLAVNHLHSYELLFRLLPGFNGLRVPGRVVLLALWPCGLLAGWALDRLGRALLPEASGRRAVLSFGVLALVFAENYHRLAVIEQYWTDARVPQAELYEKVVAALPPGAMAVIPLGGRNGDPYPVAQAAAAGWRPVLNLYSGRMPAWWETLAERQDQARTQEEAAGLMGEMRLRGIRYLIFDKEVLTPDRFNCWFAARTCEDRPWGKTVFDDERYRILDLSETEPELCLPADWASVQGSADPVCRKGTNAVECNAQSLGTLTFKPVMPLRPGRYAALFEVQAESGQVGHCQVVRVFSHPDDPRQLDPARPAVVLVESPLPEQGTYPPVRLEFFVAEEAGPEMMLEFRVVKKGKGKLCVNRVMLTPAQ
jgi:hypothetical protein